MKSGIRILVVDDEDSVRGIVSTVLGEDGHQITEAENAEKALSLFKQSPFPVVITDIRMPGMDGIQLLKSIKALQPDAQVIIMTSHASLDNAIATLRAGAYDYLIKPFEDLDLINVAVNRAAERYQFAVENCLLMEQLRHKNQQLESANRILRELANRDGLTGLYNHRYFQEVLAQEISRSERHEHAFSLVFADVDGFKRYNDQYGHPEGDRLLNSIGQIINERLRKSDTAARYGGEEFIILLPETDRQGP